MAGLLRASLPLALGVEERKRPGGVLALALLAGNRGIRFHHRPQRIEAGQAIQAYVLV